MILFINTSQTDLIDVKLIDGSKIIKEKVIKEEYKHSELLLKAIDEVIGSIKKLRAVAVVSGPGAFSALRLGVATANALAWSLEIPIIELEENKFKDDKELIKSLNQKVEALKNYSFKPVIPKYGKEPNITKAK